MTRRSTPSSASSTAGFSGSGRGLDLSLFSRPSRMFSFGLNFQNVMAPSLRLDKIGAKGLRKPKSTPLGWVVTQEDAGTADALGGWYKLVSAS